MPGAITQAPARARVRRCCCAIFAAVVLGGIGNAFGALAGGIVLGLVIEWSTLFIDARWKLAIGFVVLILVLIVRPQGIFGKAKAV